MKRRVVLFILLAGMPNLIVSAADKIRKADGEPAVLKTTADPLPLQVKQFNGMLAGRLANKDLERGTFVVLVDAVPRVWRNSKAESPKLLVGRHVKVSGVFGKWLDALLLVKKGETLEFEARHDGGDQLTFPGEHLRKVAPVKKGDYPELPEDFRGFEGVVIGKIVKKDPQLMEVTIEVSQLKSRTAKNRAPKPESIIGHRAMLGGFWQRRKAYGSLKVGDELECTVRHIQPRSDHLQVSQFRRVAKEQ